MSINILYITLISAISRLMSTYDELCDIDLRSIIVEVYNTKKNAYERYRHDINRDELVVVTDAEAVIANAKRRRRADDTGVLSYIEMIKLYTLLENSLELDDCVHRAYPMCIPGHLSTSTHIALSHYNDYAFHDLEDLIVKLNEFAKSDKVQCRIGNIRFTFRDAKTSVNAVISKLNWIKNTCKGDVRIIFPYR